MSDLDIKRLNNLTDELDKRVKNLETQKADKEEIVTIEENVSNLLFKPSNNIKKFIFNARGTSYAVANVEITSPATFEVIMSVYANGFLVFNRIAKFPFVCEVPFKTIDGENKIEVAIVSQGVTSSYKLDMKISVKGRVFKREKTMQLGTLVGNHFYFRDGDTIKCINTNTLETDICYSGKDFITASFLRDNYYTFLTKKGNSVKLERHTMGSNDSYKTIDLDLTFSDCAIEIYNGNIYLYIVKGENAYMYVYKPDNSDFLIKLPFKATSIKSFAGSTGRYIYYTDLRGNVVVIKHYSYTDFREEKSVSVGKIDNVNVCEENGKLRVIYKQGLVVLNKPVFESGLPSVLGVGDEAIITENGVKIIRQDNKLIKL